MKKNNLKKIFAKHITSVSSKALNYIYVANFCAFASEKYRVRVCVGEGTRIALFRHTDSTESTDILLALLAGADAD